MLVSRPRVLFASWHCYLDNSNGASISTRALLLELSRRGWDIETLCSSVQEFRDFRALEEVFSSNGCFLRKGYRQGDYSIFSFVDHGIESIILSGKQKNEVPSNSDISVYLHLLKAILEREKPEIVLTYGGYRLGPLIIEEARRVGAAVAVFLHNLAYKDKRYFHNVNCVFVPSKFAGTYYRQTLGLDTIPIPPLIESPQKYSTSEDIKRDCVLYFNPEIGKGVCFFVALVEELWRRRSPIRFLVVEGREGVKTLIRFGRERLKDVHSVDFVFNTDNIAALYLRAKMTLIPSLYQETFCRVAAESINFDVPVVGSNRGALPDVVGEAGILLDVAPRYTPETPLFPSRDEIVPWVDAVDKLWNDKERRDELIHAGRIQADNWRYDLISAAYEKKLLELVKR